MIVGAIVWGFLTGRVGLARSVWIGLIGAGITMMIYARMTSFIPGVIATFAISVIVQAVNVAIGPIMFRVTPRDYVGRVSATLNPLMNAASLIGLIGGGLLYSTVMQDFSVTIGGIHFGPLDTIFLVTGLLCILAGLYAISLRVPAAEIEDTSAESVPA
jgi:MFS family permease